SFHSALSVLTSIRTVSAKSDNSYKAAHLGCVRLIYGPSNELTEEYLTSSL
ncbi:hypothetical protein DEU52_1691, partial [Ensifer adhaerens]